MKLWWHWSSFNTLQSPKTKWHTLISHWTTLSFDYSTHSPASFWYAYTVSQHLFMSRVLLIFCQDLVLMMGESGPWIVSLTINRCQQWRKNPLMEKPVIIDKIWLINETPALRIPHLFSVAVIMNFAAPEYRRKECMFEKIQHLFNL